MTPKREELLDVLRAVLDHFAVGHPVRRSTYIEVMGQVRDMARRLENTQHHCPKGRHFMEAGCPCAWPSKSEKGA